MPVMISIHNIGVALSMHNDFDISVREMIHKEVPVFNTPPVYILLLNPFFSWIRFTRRTLVSAVIYNRPGSSPWLCIFRQVIFN